VPAFRELRRRVELELVKERALSKDCVLVKYRVIR
jgi:hypothetical protein